jgi:hypothetical protein
MMTKYHKGELFWHCASVLVLMNDVKDDTSTAFFFNVRTRSFEKVRVYNLVNSYSRLRDAAQR